MGGLRVNFAAARCVELNSAALEKGEKCTLLDFGGGGGSLDSRNVSFGMR